MSDEAEDCKCDGGAPAWMATFGDLMSLLLTFFVLLLSFANMDIIKFEKAMGSMRDALGVKVRDTGPFEGQTSQAVKLSESEADPATVIIEGTAPSGPTQRPSDSDDGDPEEEGRRQDAELKNHLEAAIAESDLSGLAEAVPGERGVTLRVKGALIFRSASDELRPTSAELLEKVVELARRFPYHIAVEGHTDRRPVRGGPFPSNWHLSAARAITGVQYLIDKGRIAPERLSASGFGSTRPLEPELDDAARSRNRRLEFVFYREKRSAPVDAKVADPETRERLERVIEDRVIENRQSREADLPSLE